MEMKDIGIKVFIAYNHTGYVRAMCSKCDRIMEVDATEDLMFGYNPLDRKNKCFCRSCGKVFEVEFVNLPKKDMVEMYEGDKRRKDRERLLP
jgi:hypothetical protein